MRVTIRSLGSSRYITIPPKELKKRKLTTGDDIDLLFPDEAIDEIKNIVEGIDKRNEEMFIDWKKLDSLIVGNLSSSAPSQGNSNNKIKK